MARPARLLFSLLLTLGLTSSAWAQANPRYKPPKHPVPEWRKPWPPSPGFRPPLGVPPSTTNCGPATNASSLSGDLGVAVSTQPSTPIPTNPSKIEDFPNSSDPANVKAMLDFLAEKYGLPKELLYAMAWTESRWQQWDSAGEATLAGDDYGLMQINKPTWDGEYDWTKIKTDVRYNLQAGAEILKWGYNYSKNKGKTGDALLQSTYAVYNGGPSALSRPEDSKSPYHQHDLNFWDHYTEKPWEATLKS